MKTPILLLVLLTATAWCAGDNAAPTTQPVTQPDNQSLSAEQMLHQMLQPLPSTAQPLQPGSRSTTVDKTSGNGALPPNAPPVTVMREGTFLVDRVGRLSRSNDGTQEEFIFESDGKTLKDPPVIILPNLKLMTMENAMVGANRDLRFRITGVVTEYRGRNYVLLDKVVVVPDITQQF